MTSETIIACQSCSHETLEPVFWAGYLPPVNTFAPVGTPPAEQPRYPAQLLRCPQCSLVQLGCRVDPKVVFPGDYAYRSGTTKALRDNFFDLVTEVPEVLGRTPGPSDLVLDIASNDGTLLSLFRQQYGCRVLGVEPTLAWADAAKQGIPGIADFWGVHAAESVLSSFGEASVVTATNVFAHVPDPHGFLKAVGLVLRPGGVLVLENHYLPALLRGLQYDTVYHEHLRYYSLCSLDLLLFKAGFATVHAREIPTHGGSFRVYALPRNLAALGPVPKRGRLMLPEAAEQGHDGEIWRAFRSRCSAAKQQLWRMLEVIHRYDGKVWGIGCPSRAVTFIHFNGLDEQVLPKVCEVPGSPKVGKYVPGTMIEVCDEAELYQSQPDFALLLSWHLADELAAKVRAKGFKGRFICPLPTPRVMEGI